MGAGPAVTGDAYQVGLLVGAGAAPAVGCWPQLPLAQDQADVVAGWAGRGRKNMFGEICEVPRAPRAFASLLLPQRHEERHHMQDYTTL